MNALRFQRMPRLWFDPGLGKHGAKIDHRVVRFLIAEFCSAGQVTDRGFSPVAVRPSAQKP